MRDLDLVREDIAILRETIRANDGENIATSAFARKVDQLISDFYDDIGELTGLQLGDILDLFVIKVLYVNRRSRDAETITYLGRLMERYLSSGELNLGPGKSYLPYLSDLMEEEATPSDNFAGKFETYRKYGDNALFITGVYPSSLGRKRASGRMGGSAMADKGYFITLGKRYYEMAARQDTAQWIHLRTTLERLARFFDIYVEALNEMSDRYVLGMDMQLIADKMLDAFNRYRESHDQQDLEAARKYAGLLRLDGKAWPALEQVPDDGPAYF
ncbi:MAG: hypothetical protein AB7N24_16065 [Dehalococcoidia bacterium]